MSVSEVLIDLAVQLVDPETRSAAANTIAHQLGGDSMILCVRDRPQAQLLPLPGIQPAVSAEALTPELLHECIQRRHHASELRFGRDHVEKIYAISHAEDLVLILVGTAEPNASSHEFERLLPLLAHALRADRKAEKASEARSNFLTMISHELRTPLNAIGGYVQLLQLGVHGGLSEPQSNALDRVHQSQQHLLQLINDILSLARLEASDVYYQNVDLDLLDAIRDVLPAIASQIEDKQLGLEIHPSDRAVYACADREKLQQILLNLLSNAVKFTHEGGRITVTAGEDIQRGEPMTYVEVRDTGNGIAGDQLASIFDAFVQVQSGLTRSHEGSGLGLAISRGLAKGMHGDLRVTSEPGVGSAFRLYLPAAASQNLERGRHPIESAHHG